jgi:hypothetical protein
MAPLPVLSRRKFLQATRAGWHSRAAIERLRSRPVRPGCDQAAPLQEFGYGDQKTGAKSWRVESARGAIEMLPFTEIGDQQYATYVRVS